MILLNICGWSIIIISAFLAIFQFLLAFGLPYGRFAWGGRYIKLPFKLRIGSLISAGLFLISIAVVLEKLSLFEFINNSFLLNGLIWFYFLLFALSLFANLSSGSKQEKRVMVPAASILTFCFIILAFHDLFI